MVLIKWLLFCRCRCRCRRCFVGGSNDHLRCLPACRASAADDDDDDGAATVSRVLCCLMWPAKSERPRRIVLTSSHYDRAPLARARFLADTTWMVCDQKIPVAHSFVVVVVGERTHILNCERTERARILRAFGANGLPKRTATKLLSERQKTEPWPRNMMSKNFVIPLVV